MIESNRDDILTRDLIDQAREGDKHAEALLFQSFTALLLKEARRHKYMRRLRTYISADDVVSEVWERCHASGAIRKFEDQGRGSFKRFLCTILNRTMVDSLRRHITEKRGFKRTVNTGSTIGELSSDRLKTSLFHTAKDPTPTSNARASEILELFKKILNQREQRIWNMAMCEEMNSTEIGEQLVMTPSAVRGVLARSRSKLVEALQRKLA